MLIGRAEVFLEDFGLVFGAQANACIGHGQMDRAIAIEVGTEGDTAADRRVFVGVADQIGQHLGGAVLIAPEGRQISGHVED